MEQIKLIETNNDINQKYTLIEWTTIFLMIANTTNPFFYQSVEMLILSFVFVGILSLFIKSAFNVINKPFLVFISVYIGLQIIQSYSYEIIPIKTFLGEYLRISFAILCLYILGDKFVGLFIKFVIIFAAISFVFYIPSVLLPGFADFIVTHFAKYTLAPFVNNYDGIYDIRNNLIIFNFNQIELFRNSGFYWEPGVHGGFILLALFFNCFYRKIPILKNENLILIAALITTFSTTSYIGLLFILLIYNIDFLFKKPILSVFLIMSLAFASYSIYNKFDFIGQKIQKQISYADKGVPGESRFRSFLIDIKSVSEHPLIGTGRNIQMRFGNQYYNINSQLTHRNNGIGVLLSTYGIPFFIFYISFVYLSFKKIFNSASKALYGVCLILIIGFSEDYFFKVFFIFLTIYCTYSVAKYRVKRSYKKMQTGIQA